MTSSIPGTGPGAHGGVRGMAFDRRSSQFEGRFGRMFRSLSAATWSEAALKALAGDGNQENRMAAGPEVVENSSPPRPTAAREDTTTTASPIPRDCMMTRRTRGSMRVTPTLVSSSITTSRLIRRAACKARTTLMRWWTSVRRGLIWTACTVAAHAISRTCTAATAVNFS